MVDEVQHLTVAQAAARIQTSDEMVRRLLRDGRLRGKRLGGKRAGWRIAASEVERYLSPEPEFVEVPRAPRLVPERSPARPEPPGLAPLLERAEHFRLMGNQPEAARWQRLADQLLEETRSADG